MSNHEQDTRNSVPIYFPNMIYFLFQLSLQTLPASAFILIVSTSILLGSACISRGKQNGKNLFKYHSHVQRLSTGCCKLSVTNFRNDFFALSNFIILISHPLSYTLYVPPSECSSRLRLKKNPWLNNYLWGQIYWKTIWTGNLFWIDDPYLWLSPLP